MPAALAALILLLPVPLGTAGEAAVPAPMFSDAEWNRSRPAEPLSSSGGAVIGRAALGLGISLTVIVGLAIGLGVAVKKLGRRRLLPGRGRHLDVIETVPLGFKRAISLIRLGDQVLVVGQGEHELHHLATLPASVLGAPADPVDPADPGVVVPGVPPAPTTSAFRSLLERLGSGRP
jgi:flagellar biogenesis protein FliO